MEVRVLHRDQNKKIMSKVVLRKNILEWSFDRGQTASLFLINEEGWDYDEVKMEIKTRREIKDSPMITLTEGNGITIEGDRMTCRLSSEQTKSLPSSRASADIKIRKAQTVFPAIPIAIIINPTVTDL